MHRYTSKVPSKDTNSRFQTNKTLAVRSHFKIGSHFSGNPVIFGPIGFMVVSAVDLLYVFGRSFVLFELTLLVQFVRGTRGDLVSVR